MKKINGCPYCGSKKGFSRFVTTYSYDYFDAEGNFTRREKEQDSTRYSWRLPRCLSCKKSVSLEEV